VQRCRAEFWADKLIARVEADPHCARLVRSIHDADDKSVVLVPAVTQCVVDGCRGDLCHIGPLMMIT
jgi:hypothetical protein